MPDKFELIYYFHHCGNTTVYSAGRTDSEEEAQLWVKERERSGSKSRERDLQCNCRAGYCPVKYSDPVYTYRKIEA